MSGFLCQTLQVCLICDEDIHDAKDKIRMKCCHVKCHASCVIKDLATKDKERMFSDNEPYYGIPANAYCPIEACDAPVRSRFLWHLQNTFTQMWDEAFIHRTATRDPDDAAPETEVDTDAEEGHTLARQSDARSVAETLPPYEEPPAYSVRQENERRIGGPARLRREPESELTALPQLTVEAPRGAQAQHRDHWRYWMWT